MCFHQNIPNTDCLFDQILYAATIIKYEIGNISDDNLTCDKQKRKREIEENGWRPAKSRTEGAGELDQTKETHSLYLTAAPFET